MKTLLTLLMLLPFLAFSQSETKGVSPIKQSTTTGGGATRAVVIGISDYQEKDIPDLRFADKDAEAFANFLRSPAGGSLDNDHLKVLTNQQATAGRVAEALDALVEQTKEGDQVIIYFSGHGDVERKTISQPGFLLCWDSPARVYMGGGTYSLAFLQEIVTTLSVQNKAKVLVITDACHAGKLSGSQIGGAQLTSANLAKQYANEVKILSCQPNEFSLEGDQWGGGHGCFSYHLVDGLYGLADRNGDGTVTVGEMDRYLEDHVTAEAAPQSQVPMLLGNKTELLAMVNAAMLADLKKSKAGGLPVFTATEGRGFEEEVLAKADSSVRQHYLAFKKAVSEKRFFPVGKAEHDTTCADELFAQLFDNESIAPLRGVMKRNYAAALQDDAQQAMNTMLKTGLTSIILIGIEEGVTYRNYPAYLARAAELLGPGHYFYATLKAREAFFEGKIRQKRAERRPFFLQALKWQPELPHAYRELISCCTAAELDSANLYFQKALNLAPGWVSVYEFMADYFQFTRNEPNQADSLLDVAGRLDTASVLIWYRKGRFYFDVKQYEKSEYWYRKAVAASGSSICFPCAHNQLGFLYYDRSRFAEAEEQYRLAIALDSTFFPAYGNLVTVLEHSERYPEAEQLLLRYQQHIDSNDYRIYEKLFGIYFLAERLSEAERTLQKGIALNPNFSPFFQYSGDLYLEFKRPDDAEKSYRQALGLNPANADAHYGLAAVHTLRRDFDQAFVDIENACKNGYWDYDWLQEDPGMAILRQEEPERWKAMMKKYFPDKVKD